MQLNLDSVRQCKIAQLLWEAKDLDEADLIVAEWGQEAALVQELMILAMLDEEGKVVGPEVRSLLKKFG